MMKQFAKTMLTVIGLAIAAAVLSAVPGQAQAGSNVVNHGFIASFGIFDFNTGELIFVTISTTNNNTFSYQMFGPTSGAGSGSIPASSVTVSGSSVNAGNVTFALNVNTCDLDPVNFKTTAGSCGPFNITLVQIPASVGGSTVTSGTSRVTTPGVGTTIINGHTETFSAVLSGSMLGFVLPNGPLASLEELNQATVTHTK
jgi:hypothetical protein